MENIKFIDREKELKILDETKKKSFFLVLKGRRRIGKTTLARTAYPNARYIFIWPNKSIEWMTNEISKEHNLPKFTHLIDLIDYLLDKNEILILDEFQNFLNIDKSFYGEFQKLIDNRKINNKKFKILVSGSSYSLINKVFNDEASPLYGRRTHELTLKELPLEEIYKTLDIEIENFIKIWSVFGGVPYYYELIDYKKPIEKSIKDMIEKDSILVNEGQVVLSVEFGKDSKTYNTVLTVISEGKTKLNEIASVFSNKKSDTIKYIDLLRKEFNLVKRVTPILSDPRKSKEGIYQINDNFLSFWFKFIDNRKPYIEQERYDELVNYFEKNFPDFVGHKFEKFIIYLIKKKLFFKETAFDKLGKQWGKILDAPKEANAYEIDIVGINETKKEILFAECKWKNKVNAEKVLKELSEKTKYVNWYNNERKETYAVFANSFSKKINEFEGKKVSCYDLKDIQKELKK